MKKFYVLGLALCFLTVSAFAAVVPEFTINIKDHKFIPAVIEVPANQQFKLIVRNSDRTLEEFESTDLSLEKIVMGNKQIMLIVRPLKPGSYNFFGDFHAKTAQGKIVVK